MSNYFFRKYAAAAPPTITPAEIQQLTREQGLDRHDFEGSHNAIMNESKRRQQEYENAVNKAVETKLKSMDLNMFPTDPTALSQLTADQRRRLGIDSAGIASQLASADIGDGLILDKFNKRLSQVPPLARNHLPGKIQDIIGGGPYNRLEVKQELQSPNSSLKLTGDKYNIYKSQGSRDGKAFSTTNILPNLGNFGNIGKETAVLGGLGSLIGGGVGAVTGDTLGGLATGGAVGAGGALGARAGAKLGVEGTELVRKLIQPGVAYDRTTQDLIASLAGLGIGGIGGGVGSGYLAKKIMDLRGNKKKKSKDKE